MQTNAQSSTSPVVLFFQSHPLHAASLALAVAGALNAAYLSWTKLTNTAVYCGPGSQACDAVQASVYGQLMGFPVAYLGLASYLALIVLLALEGPIAFLKFNGPVMVFGLTLVGTLFSGYLQYASLFLLQEVCPYCVLNALLMLTLFVLSIFRLRQALNAAAAE
jgi:uncharacterized membrane protein